MFVFGDTSGSQTAVNADGLMKIICMEFRELLRLATFFLLLLIFSRSFQCAGSKVRVNVWRQNDAPTYTHHVLAMNVMTWSSFNSHAQYVSQSLISTNYEQFDSIVLIA